MYQCEGPGLLRGPAPAGGSCCRLFSWLRRRLLPVAVGQILTYPDPAAPSYLQPCLWAPSGLCFALSSPGCHRSLSCTMLATTSSACIVNKEVP